MIKNAQSDSDEEAIFIDTLLNMGFPCDEICDLTAFKNLITDEEKSDLLKKDSKKMDDITGDEEIAEKCVVLEFKLP